MTDTAELTLEAFEAEARAFLDEHAEPKQQDEGFVWGKGAENVGLFDERSREQEQEGLRRAKEWRAQVFDAGYGWLTGPREYGGRELPQAYARAWAAVESQYVIPNQGFFGIGLGMVAPTVLDHGTDVTKDRYLKAMHRGEIVGCQLFSEPGAGSDLASLQSRAEQDGEEWVLNGQKVWTSGAQYSDIGEIIVRTDTNLPKHRGLTGFIVDMHAPGVEVRPLRQMTGGASFNEVFFTDVRVPDDHRLGDVNHGWTVALTTLMNERAAIGTGPLGGGGTGTVTRLIEMVRHFELDTDPLVRNELAGLIASHRAAAYTNQRAMDRIKAGQLPGPELSIAKMALTRNLAAVCDFASRVLGPRIIADTGEWGTYAWSQIVLGLPGLRVAGGSDEVLRNIVGERVLGLPKEPGIDTTSPFRELKVGTQKS